MKGKYPARIKRGRNKPGSTVFSLQLHAMLAAVFTPDVAV